MIDKSDVVGGKASITENHDATRRTPAFERSSLDQAKLDRFAGAKCCRRAGLLSSKTFQKINNLPTALNVFTTFTKSKNFCYILAIRLMRGFLPRCVDSRASPLSTDNRHDTFRTTDAAPQ